MDTEDTEIDMQEKEPAQPVETAPAQDPEEEPERAISDRGFILTVMIIILVLAALLWLVYIYKDKEGPTVDEMNALCLAGKLDKDVCYVYKDAYVFTKLEGLWYTRVQGQGITAGIPLHFHPGDLKDIPVTGSYNHSLFNQTPYFYITFDPIGADLGYVALAIGEFDRNMLAAFGKTPIAACLINETQACQARPIINCTNTQEPVIYMKQANESAVILNNNCITIQGTGPDLVKATDRMLLSFYNIM